MMCNSLHQGGGGTRHNSSAAGTISEKDVKREGFALAEVRYAELLPLLERLNELEQQQAAEEQEQAPRAGSRRGAGKASSSSSTSSSRGGSLFISGDGSAASAKKKSSK